MQTQKTHIKLSKIRIDSHRLQKLEHVNRCFKSTFDKYYVVLEMQQNGHDGVVGVGNSLFFAAKLITHYINKIYICVIFCVGSRANEVLKRQTSLLPLLKSSYLINCSYYISSLAV